MHYIAGAWMIPRLLQREHKQQQQQQRKHHQQASATHQAQEQEREPGAAQQLQQQGDATQQLPEGKQQQGPEANAAGAVEDWGGGTGVVFMAAHTVMTHVTGQYAPATAGMGVTLPFAFLNR